MKTSNKDTFDGSDGSSIYFDALAVFHAPYSADSATPMMVVTCPTVSKLDTEQ